jgi:hypothetical protein
MLALLVMSPVVLMAVVLAVVGAIHNPGYDAKRRSR